MSQVETVEELAALYEAPPNPTSLTKVRDHITPLYRDWIMASRFCILSTVGPEGTDASPRGDDGPVVAELDPNTLALPDWKGKNRLDSLRNIVRDERVSLMFMVPGATNVVRVNGSAVLRTDPDLLARFARPGGAQPRSVIVITIAELYFQCAKAIMRSKLWSDAAHPKVPSAGALIKEVDASFDGETYDRTYPEYAKPQMW
jgi:PPOX class probable FMN-dependent enzyme